MNGKIDLKDITFLIPIRVDCPERKENLQLVLQFLNASFNTSVTVLEADQDEQAAVPENIQKKFVKDQYPLFHRTKYLNRMTAEAKTPYLAVWDADVIGVPSQLEAGVTLLRRNEADMVFPYNKYFYSVSTFFKELYVSNHCNPDILIQAKEYMDRMHGDWSVGGGFLVNRTAYIEAGMENENFHGWGPEDAERMVRWDTLGYRVKRVDGPLFHLHHPRKGWFDNGKTEIQNRKEFLKVCAMDKQQLEQYICETTWMQPVIK